MSVEIGPFAQVQDWTTCFVEVMSELWVHCEKEIKHKELRQQEHHFRPNTLMFLESLECLRCSIQWASHILFLIFNLP